MNSNISGYNWFVQGVSYHCVSIKVPFKNLCKKNFYDEFQSVANLLTKERKQTFIHFFNEHLHVNRLQCVIKCT